MTLSFTIRGRLPSMNDAIAAGRANRYWAAKLKRDCEVDIEKQLRPFRLKPFTEPVRVHFDWYEPNQRRDVDNISAYGKKVILDALVSCGVLKKDSQRYVKGTSDEVHVDKDNPRIEVTIETVDV